MDASKHDQPNLDDCGVAIPRCTLHEPVNTPTVGAVCRTEGESRFFGCLVDAIRDIVACMGDFLPCEPWDGAVSKMYQDEELRAVHSVEIRKASGWRSRFAVVEKVSVELNVAGFDELAGTDANAVIYCGDGVVGETWRGYLPVFQMEMTDSDLSGALLHRFIPGEEWIDAIANLSDKEGALDLYDASGPSAFYAGGMDGESADGVYLKLCDKGPDTEKVNSAIAVIAGAKYARKYKGIADLIGCAPKMLLKFPDMHAAFAADAMLLAAGAHVEPVPNEFFEVEPGQSFSVVLDDYGDSKIPVIKELRILFGLGLKEAKDLVDSAPVVVLENAEREDAERVVSELLEAGASAHCEAVRADASRDVGSTEYFDVVLERLGDDRLEVLDYIGEFTGLGIKAVVDLVKDRPCPILEHLDLQDAERVVSKLLEAGATASIDAREE